MFHHRPSWARRAAIIIAAALTATALQLGGGALLDQATPARGFTPSLTGRALAVPAGASAGGDVHGDGGASSEAASV